MINVITVEPGELPHVSGRDAAALTHAARVLAGFPATLEVPLGELGVVVLSREGVAPLRMMPGGEPTGEIELGLTRAPDAGRVAGRIVLDGGLARRLIAAALGVDVRSDTPLIRLGPGERGLVAGLVASSLHALRAPFSVSLVAPPLGAVADGGGVAIALAVAFAGANGWARLELPSRWLAASPPAKGEELRALEVEACVELARTHLPAGELAGVVAGDAIVFDGEPAFDCRVIERAVRVLVADHAARARLSEDGRVTLEGTLRPAPIAARAQPLIADGQAEGIMESRDTVGTESGESSTRPLDVAAVLAAAPIEVVAELGRLTLRGDEVAGLGTGAVLTLGRVGASPVCLRVGGEIWAEGELVDVDGELGVRITASRRSRLR